MPSPVHPPKRRTSGMMALAVSGLFALIMLIAAVQGIPRFRPLDPPDPGEAPSEPLPEPSSTSAPPPEPEPSVLGQILTVIVLALIAATVLALVIWVVTMVVRAALDAWASRALRTRTGSDADTSLAGAAPEDAEPRASVVRRGIAAALDAIETRPDPGDAIVAAWLGLEETAADAGVTRAVSETPGEFAIRIITRRQGIADEALALLGLYERVRFGGHSADERERALARTLLERIERGWR